MALHLPATGRTKLWLCATGTFHSLNMSRSIKHNRSKKACQECSSLGPQSSVRRRNNQLRPRMCNCAVAVETVVDPGANDYAPADESQSPPRWLVKIRQSPTVPSLYQTLVRMNNMSQGPVVHCGLVKLAHLVRYQGTNNSNRRAVKQLSKELILAARLVVNQLTPRSAVDILWCSTFVPYKDPILIHQLVCGLYGHLQSLPLASLFKLITTLTRIKYPVSREWMDGFLSVLVPQAQDLSPEQVAALMRVCKQLKYNLPEVALEMFYSETSSKLHDCKLNTLSVMLECVPGWYQPPLNWQQEMLAATQSKLELATPKELAQIISGLPQFKCKCSDDWLVEYLSECLEQLQSFTAQELVTVIAGLAALRVKPDSTWLQAYMFQAKDRLPEFLASELAALVTSLARLGCKPSPAWMQAMCRQAERSVVFAGPEQAASLLHGLSKIGHKPEPSFVTRFLQHTRFKLCLLDASQAVELMSAVGELQFPINPAWCSELFLHTQSLLDGMTPSMLVELVAGLGAWGVCPPPVWQQKLAKALMGHMQRFRDPQRVCLITNLRKLSRTEQQLEPVLLQVITQLWESTAPQVTYHMPGSSMLPASQQTPGRQISSMENNGLNSFRFDPLELNQPSNRAMPSKCVLIEL